MADNQLCPACSLPIVPPRASSSRFHPHIFICSDCGVREALDGFFWQDEFNKAGPNGPTQPAGYNPWEIQRHRSVK